MYTPILHKDTENYERMDRRKGDPVTEPLFKEIKAALKRADLAGARHSLVAERFQVGMTTLRLIKLTPNFTAYHDLRSTNSNWVSRNTPAVLAPRKKPGLLRRIFKRK